mgnify:CR=1 FL=1
MPDKEIIAPDFTLPDTDGNEVTLSALRPALVVLFFYPRDNTPGCTTEAIAFTQNLAAFQAAGAHVFGISKDDLLSHAKFRDKQDLAVPLLSDENSTVCEAYGVWREKKMYGKVFMGIERSTFLISGTGEFVKEWRKVKVPGHVEEVLAEVQNQS